MRRAVSQSTRQTERATVQPDRFLSAHHDRATHLAPPGPSLDIRTVHLQLSDLAGDAREVMLERRQETREGIQEGGT